MSAVPACEQFAAPAGRDRVRVRGSAYSASAGLSLSGKLAPAIVRQPARRSRAAIRKRCLTLQGTGGRPGRAPEAKRV